MLGGSIISFATPVCLGYAIHTFRDGVARRYSVAALCLAIGSAAPIAFVLIVGIVMGLAQAF
jgi:hypothetical protein